jgi:hypothetical protein
MVADLRFLWFLTVLRGEVLSYHKSPFHRDWCTAAIVATHLPQAQEMIRQVSGKMRRQ